MKVTCPKCEAVYSIDDSKIPDKGAYGNCPKCKERFFVKKEDTPSEPKKIEKTQETSQKTGETNDFPFREDEIFEILKEGKNFSEKSTEKAQIETKGRKTGNDGNTITDEKEIRKMVESRVYDLHPIEDWFTPSGNKRSFPMYEATVENEYLGKNRLIKSKNLYDLEQKAEEQISKWNEQEIKKRAIESTKDAKERAQAQTEEASREAQEEIESIKSILLATLDIDDRLKWASLVDKREYPAFKFDTPRPKKPSKSSKEEPPQKSFFEFLIPTLKRKRLEGAERLENKWREKVQRQETDYQKRLRLWEKKKLEAEKQYDAKKRSFLKKQHNHNRAVKLFKTLFENGEKKAIEEYLAAVFERSTYPDSFFTEYEVVFDEPSKTVVVELNLPPQEKIPDIIEYTFVSKNNSKKPIRMKKKDHDELYDSALKQAVLRTMHEVFESAYTPHVEAVVVNGWVTSVELSTGNEKTSCIISVSSNREELAKFNLKRVEPTACIKGLKGLLAGPLSQVAPVQPILHFDKEDSRFIESKEVLAEINSATNLAEIPWEEFEHLVRELFGKMFSDEGAEVKVTQCSSDGGVDAIAFDPDPIRGGKFVIQAKRYTRVVSVAAVRDLYGTMINEGAVKGILVTTAHYGRESREFAKDKPITLIDGSNLVYLLEKYGHKVRIDVEAARAARQSEIK